MGSVLLTRRVPSSVVAPLEAQHDVEVHRGDGAIPRGELLERVRGKDALICVLTDRIDEELLDAGSQLKIVANIAVGYDNIDVAAVRRHGLVATNTPDVLTEATAELTWTLILATARRVVEGDRLVRAGGWTGWTLDFMLGTELRGKQLGIVGAGRIGRAVAAKAPAFGMTAVFARRPGAPTPQPSREQNGATGEAVAQWSERKRGAGGHRGEAAAPSASLDEVLVTSDVISLHVPANAETRNLIDRKAFARMKRSAFLINTARGAVVDEDALFWALDERLIAGAGLDVYLNEPSIDPRFATYQNVVVAPHLGSATRETRLGMIELAVRNVMAVLGGEPPLTPIV